MVFGAPRPDDALEPSAKRMPQTLSDEETQLPIGAEIQQASQSTCKFACAEVLQNLHSIEAKLQLLEEKVEQVRTTRQQLMKVLSETFALMAKV